LNEAATAKSRRIVREGKGVYGEKDESRFLAFQTCPLIMVLPLLIAEEGLVEDELDMKLVCFLAL
jgi:hypothetical protein